MKLIESDYGRGGQNFHVDRWGQDVHVTLTYPGIGDPRQATHIVVNQESVRASDGLRLHYDYDRDGFVVEQNDPEKDGTDRWVETGFFQSWALQRPNGDRS